MKKNLVLQVGTNNYCIKRKIYCTSILIFIIVYVAAIVLFNIVKVMLFEAIQDAPIDVRPELYRHIVLSGGSSMYPGLPSRLEKELKQLYLERVAEGDVSRLKVRINTNIITC